MKLKPMVMMYGNILTPVIVGQKVVYHQNGKIKSTGRVVQILEQEEDHVKFDTETCRYCINYSCVGTGDIAMVA